MTDLLIDFLLIFGPASFLLVTKKDPVKELGLYPKGIKTDFLNAAMLLIALIVISLLITAITSLFQLNDLDKVAERVKFLQQSAPVIFAYLLIVRVVSEEIFFRGFLVGRIGWIGASIDFGLAHIFYGSIVEVFGAVVLGGVLAKAFEKNGNLIPNILAHMVYNLIFVVTLI